MEASLVKVSFLLSLIFSLFSGSDGVKSQPTTMEPYEGPPDDIYCLYLKGPDKQTKYLDTGHYHTLDKLLTYANKTEMVNYLLEPEPHREGPGYGDNISYRDALEFTYFMFYSKNKPKGTRLYLNAEEIKKAGWKSHADLKILIHGFNQTGNMTLMPLQLKDAYLAKYPGINILVVDWGKLADKEVLKTAEAPLNIYAIGRVVGEFIKFLQIAGLTHLSGVHIVGYDLGAHIAGGAGYFVTDRTGRQVSRITGLDPANEGFDQYTEKFRILDSSDAAFVDIIHTNMGRPKPKTTDPIPEKKVKYPVYGTWLPSGHVDFYPNGGVVQPGCGPLDEPPPSELCSHEKVLKYFVESIKGAKPWPYKGCHCASYNDFVGGGCGCPHPSYMGEPSDKSSRGPRYLTIY